MISEIPPEPLVPWDKFESLRTRTRSQEDDVSCTDVQLIHLSPAHRIQQAKPRILAPKRPSIIDAGFFGSSSGTCLFGASNSITTPSQTRSTHAFGGSSTQQAKPHILAPTRPSVIDPGSIDPSPGLFSFGASTSSTTPSQTQSTHAFGGSSTPNWEKSVPVLPESMHSEKNKFGCKLQS